MNSAIQPREEGQEVRIQAGKVTLAGNLSVPKEATGVVIFAHGSGSSRHSPRNQYVASVLREAGLGTLLFDLLTKNEEAEDMYRGHLRFNIRLLADRMVASTDWFATHTAAGRTLQLGYFGASTGAAAALVAATERRDLIHAVVSRGGRPDLAGPALSQVKAPTLLIVGGNDISVIGINREAFDQLRSEKQLVVVPGATHLFEEPGALDEVARLAAQWFLRHLGPIPAHE
jgi:putative phosphoribosyl transferase